MNYVEFVAFMHIHMRGICLRVFFPGGLVSTAPSPLVGPIPLTPSVLAADAMIADDAAAYDQ
jgi:hypothetical protein